jgi:hypothetical protein
MLVKKRIGRPSRSLPSGAFYLYLSEYRISAGTVKNGGEMKSNRVRKTAKTQQGLLLDVARSIGSTLGTLAARTGGVSKHRTRHVVSKKARTKPVKSRTVRSRKRRAA